MTYGLEDVKPMHWLLNIGLPADKATVVNLRQASGFFNLAGMANPTPTVLNHI